MLIGAALTAFLAAFAPYNDFYLCNTFFTGNHLPIGVVFMMLALTLVVNSVWKLVAEGSHLRSSELAVIWTMMACGGAMVGSNLMRYWYGALVLPTYHGLSNPTWEPVIKLIPPGLLPTSDPDSRIIWDFVEGKASVPWGTWIAPLLLWTVYIGSMFMMLLCVSVIIRNQWTYNENLAFPLAQYLQELVREPAKGRMFNDFFRNRLTWLGAAVPIVYFGLHGLHTYYPRVPAIPITWNVRQMFSSFPWNAASGDMSEGNFHISMIAFAMLVPSDIAFSLWFFFLLFGMEDVARVGLGSPKLEDPGIARELGGTLALFLMLLWNSRAHLGKTFRAAYAMMRGMPAGGEYRAEGRAAIGAAFFMAVCVVWMRWWGMAVVPALAFMSLVVVINVVLARAVCEAGMFHVELRVDLANAIMMIFGARLLGWQTAAILFICACIIGADLREVLLPHAMNSHRLASGCGGIRLRPLLAAMALGIGVALVSGTISNLLLQYNFGLHREDSYGNAGHYQGRMGYILTCFRGIRGDGRMTAHALSGMAITGFLAFMRISAPWWPFHPLGFVMGFVYPVRCMWLSIFMGWFIKLCVLRYGGAGLYNRLRPVIYGAIMGECLIAGVWMVVAVIVYLSGSEPYPIRILPT